MYLKSIEVQGFKSFAKKIKFEFHNGITGIVGPNGSGKSNVADAVRWVLGEQKVKQLRGASMQDVIFAGTENRKAQSYAYVSITLDNSDRKLPVDFEEVTIARRIYRSGESEYLINGTNCRLRDIHELFYDTGIGKEGYSIIGQDQVSKILSGKPEERRELFDEAAGIVKFKRRKEQALKKLDQEQQNLVRVKDILSELEHQVGPLERQSEKAKIYLSKKSELKNLDIAMFLQEHERLQTNLEDVESKIKIVTSDLQDIKDQNSSAKKEYEEIEVEIENLEKSIEEGRNRITNSSVLAGQLDGEIKVLRERIHSAKDNEAHLQKRKEAVQLEIDEKEEELKIVIDHKNEMDERVAEIEKTKQDAAFILTSLESNIEEINQKIEDGKNLIIRELNERATIKSKMGRFDTMTEQVNIRKAELNSKILMYKSEESSQEDKIKILQEEFHFITEKIANNNTSLQDMEEKLHIVNGSIRDNEEKKAQLQTQFHQEKSKLEAISNLTERYDGYGHSVKAVMERKNEVSGLIGVVADIIQVDKKYETAIEIALGGNIQNIVTDNEQTAKEMIQFLKQTKGGRATFLPLTQITDPQDFKTPEVLNEKGVIGLADSLVSIDEKYQDVAKAMLGRIVCVDTFDHASAIAKKYSNGIRMVTIEGELFVPGGAISGGRFKNNSNLLGRRREIEELTKQVNLTSEQIKELVLSLERSRDKKSTLRTEIEELKKEMQQLFLDENTARLNVMKAQERKEEAGKGFEELRKDEFELDQQLNAIKEDKNRILMELEQSVELEKTTQESIVMLQKDLEQVRLQYTKQDEVVSAVQLDVEKMIQKQGFEMTNMQRIQIELNRYLDEMKEIVQALEKNAQDILEKTENITEIEKTISNSGNVKEDTEQKLREDIARKEEFSKKQKSFFGRREELSERESSLDKESYRLHAQQEKLEMSIESQINYMWEEYEITLSSATSLQTDMEMELTLIRRQIAVLKDEIKKLGDINVNAIEEYKILMERYTFLKTQHDDLVVAEETLVDIVNKLDHEMRKQFNEKFDLISKEFDKVFKELFGGGKGTLELMEHDDVLEAGVSIIAQPPGKKLQNMMQLSGGEKALTAIALLFAIQNLKPSPFCLLDEIEAALDENNVIRFAKYLHKLKKHTQFIVITHRRGTMEKVDRLYGITMQEKGVSTLVGVDLIDKVLEQESKN